ncbi:hypothetical protein Tco_0642999, partial [Tanacetum coccineum]
MESQSETTQTVFALKLPILKKRDYDLWSMGELYNNLKVYEAEIKSQSSSRSSSQN